MHVIGVKMKETKSAQDIFDALDGYRKKNDIFIQIFDVDKVVGKEHLFWAYQKAEESFGNKSNRANSLEIETILWASAEWQIKDALDKMGIDDGAEEAAVMIDDKTHLDGILNLINGKRDDALLEPTEEKLKNFGIDEEEIGSVVVPYDLVFEKMATSVL